MALLLCFRYSFKFQCKIVEINVTKIGYKENHKTKN